MGVSFFREQRFAAAASHFRRALALRPDFEKSRSMLEEALKEGGESGVDGKPSA
jgi:uncharacterized protein HemY